MKKTTSGIMVVLLITSMLLLSFNIEQATSSEPPTTEWDRTYGGTSDESASCVVQTSDGGYAMAGRTESFGAGDMDFWLVKTDANGNQQWNRTYGGTERDEAYSVVQTDDRGYAIAGYTKSFGAGSSDFWLVKINSTGDEQWNKTYGGANYDFAESMVQTDDGG